MTISASKRAEADSDRLERTLEMYRDLTVALQVRITHLTSGNGVADCKDLVSSVKEHSRALQSVLDIEASLDKRNRPIGEGGEELDLSAARGEILARLALWASGE